MKVGISTASLFQRRNTEEAVTTIKQLGVSVAEVFLSTFYEYRPEFSKAMKEKINGLEINSVHAMSTNFEPNFFSPDSRVRGDGFYWLDQIMRSAVLLGCKNYTFHGFFRNSVPTGQVFDNFDKLGSYLGNVVDFASGYAVNLCLENVSWCTYNRPGFFTEMKRRCPNLLGVFDIKQARRSHYPWQAYINDMAGSIAYVHLSDIDENGKMCLPGEGMYDFKEIIKRLQGSGFDGNLIIEAYSGDFNDIGELKKSCDFLNEIVYKVT
jgi:sugar phosphate isomerase/epimerase